MIMHPHPGFSFAAKSVRGDHRTNDDAFLARPLGIDHRAGLFAVADGISGHIGGAQAARTAILHLERLCERIEDHTVPATADALARAAAEARKRS